MNGKNRRLRKLVILFLGVVLLAALVVVLFAVSKWNKIQHIDPGNMTDEEGKTIISPGWEDSVVSPDLKSDAREEMKKGSINFVVFGVDARNNTQLVSGVNTDVIMIFNVNKDTGDIRIASVYRDTYMYMPSDSSYNKVNYPSASKDVIESMRTLNYNLDLALTDCVVVNWKSVADAINMLGGVDNVDVTPEMFEYINGYITFTVEATGIGSTQLTAPGVQHLDGVQAVAYARVRKIDSDYGRTDRQREIFSKMLEKAKNADPVTLMSIADYLLGEMATTMEVTEVMDLCRLVPNMKLTATTGYPFYPYTQEWVASIPHDWPVIPMNHEINVSQLHEFLFDQKNYQVTPMVHEISDRLTEMSGVGAPEETTAVTRE